MSLPPRSAATLFHRNFSLKVCIKVSGLLFSCKDIGKKEKGAGSRPLLGHRSHAHTCKSTDKQSKPFGELSEVTDAVNLNEGSYLGCRLRKQDT